MTHEGPAITFDPPLSISYRHGTSGVYDTDRQTVLVSINKESTDSDLENPGHLLNQAKQKGSVFVLPDTCQQE